MTVEEINQQVENAVSDSGVQILLKVFQNIQNLPNAEIQDLITKYQNLMELYASCRIYEHRLRKKYDYDFYGCGFGKDVTLITRRIYKLMSLLQEINERKMTLRNELEFLGVPYKQYHRKGGAFNESLVMRFMGNLPLTIQQT